MYWILNRTVKQSHLGVSIGREHFTDLDYADDVALLAEMLQTLVAGLLVLQDEAAPLGLQINRGGATPGPGRSYALPLKNLDLALGPACEILIKYNVRS